MIVMLIGKNVLYRIKLPRNPIGNYWISDEKNKKLINIEGDRVNWKINSNKNLKIIKPNSVTSLNASKIDQSPQNVIEQAILREYSVNYIYLKDYSNNVFVLYCAPTCEKNYLHLDIKKTRDITIGSGENCDIYYNNPLVKEKQARIFYSSGRLMLESWDNNYGTFVNKNPADQKFKLLFNGDVIFIMGLKIIIIGNSIYINNPFNRVKYNEKKFKVNNFAVNLSDFEDEEGDDNNVELYSENDYFARAPRITKIIERETIKIDSPPQSEQREQMPLLYVLGTSLSMGLIMIISIISTSDRLASGKATLKDSIFALSTSVAMLITMLFMPLLTRKYEKKQKIKHEQKRQKRYREYINSKIELIDEIMQKQKNILYENYISAEECARIIEKKGSRLWERKIEEPDFLDVRIGIGDTPLEADIQYPEVEFTMDDDNLVEILNTIVNKSKILKNVPEIISLTEKNIAALIVENDERLVEKFTQNLIMQLIALHSYSDLKLVFLLKEDKTNKWEHLKTLPHIWDDSKQIRFWAEDYNDMKEISRYLEMQMAERLRYDNLDYRAFSPYYLIITDDYKKIENLKIISQILECGRNVGFGIFCITNNLLNLPNGCKAFINLKGNNGLMFENEISSTNKKEFTFDPSYTFFFEKIGKQLSDIPIKYETTNKIDLPDIYTFLEMYDVGRIEQLNILERWRTNDSTKSLQAPVGVDSSGMPIVLDVHEKFHGPHGLVAGSTGSGKSQFIITYILSLAVNYHPNDVAVIIIDYKGGEVAGAFKKNNMQLPHLVGTITNIDTVGLQRSLASIQSELRRRQLLFNEARNKTDEGVIDIYKYQKLYHDGVLKEPIPHLLIICDEFAELKQQQAEFMDELISVARIGRSLGVHLILATQKPAGIVNDQIRSNSKFGICLKVQETADSMDVIKSPVAANLQKRGQFYLQVGNNEYFVLGLAAWAGAPYIPSDIIKKEVDTSIKFVSNVGAVIKEVGSPKRQKQKSQGEQLTNIVRYMSDLAKVEKIQARPLWMENIPAIIYIDQIRTKYKIKPTKNVIKPVIGEFDDPYNQRQGAVELNLSSNGNTIIYGNAESGKETLLSAVVYDIMTSHTAEEAIMYILDFGSEALKIFKDSPSVGDIIFASDTEKINRLFEMLQKEIKIRTSILSDYNGDYNLYINTNGKVMPMIVIMINNYETFQGNYEDKYEDVLLTLSREGTKCGIVFIITASSYNSLRYRLTQNFVQKIALLLNNQDEYYSIFEGIGKKRPANIFGRGLVKLEDIYEFQTARICEPEKWNTYIKETNERLNKENKMKAKGIPVLPKRVTLEHVKKALKGLNSIPIGINKNNLEICTYNFKKRFINMVTAKNIDIAAEFMLHIIEEINQLNGVKLVTFDAERIFQTESNIDEEYKKFVEELETPKTENTICVILGLDRFINEIEGKEKNFYEMLKTAEKLENYCFIIVDNFIKLKRREYDEWYKNFVNNDSGIWVGNGIADQYLISVVIKNRNLANNCGDSFGHVIEREIATEVKLLGMKDRGEDDE